MTDYVGNLSSTVRPFREDAERTADKLRKDATITNGVIRWNSNGSVPPEDCVALAAHIGLAVNVARCTAERNREIDAFLAEYRRNPPRLSPEDRAEALRELGPDAVNVVTGRRIADD